MGSEPESQVDTEDRAQIRNRMGGRCYVNPYQPYYRSHRETNCVDEDGEIKPQFLEHLRAITENLMTILQQSLASMGKRDYSMYTGTSGIALLYFLMAKKHNEPKYLREAIHILEESFPKLKKKDVTFLIGDVGPLALGAVVYHHLGQTEKAAKLIKRIRDMVPFVLNLKLKLPDEVLFGRAGFLYGLLFLNEHISKETIDGPIIREVVRAILISGQTRAGKEKRSVPLMYKWYGEYYLGAAHGLAGIMFMLLQARSFVGVTELGSLVKPTIDYLLLFRCPTGNYRATLDDPGDALVQWCHGAPGFVDLFALAYAVFGMDTYYDAALKCGETVWKYGILTKGYSICHGVAGNGYTFLTLFQLTEDPRYLHEACKFAEWCGTYGECVNREPDRPFSLFEGLAGVIYFLVDIQDPMNARFPCYSI